jgi:tripartite ATP-independent transporter DctM subunit
VDEALSGVALALMVLVPMLEIVLRASTGLGVDNASVLVQHLGLVMTMFGAVAAERYGHLTSLGSSLGQLGTERTQALVKSLVQGASSILAGVLALASWRFVATEMAAPQALAYGVPIWWVQASMPLGFMLLGFRLGSRCSTHAFWRWPLALILPVAGWVSGAHFDGTPTALAPGFAVLAVMLVAGAPVFAVLGGLSLLLFAGDALPLASVSLSHYQITVNASLPSLPLYTLAGLILARSGAVRRLSVLFVAVLGGGVRGSVIAAAVLCSAFTAFTGGSGVTILALGGLLLPLLMKAGYPEQRGIGLVTSASALGVLLAPSVPLILYAVIARVPITDMFLAGLVPAILMVLCLLLLGGFLRREPNAPPAAAPDFHGALAAAWAAKWELATPLVALGSLLSGLATPMESAALTAAYALFTQALVHRELGLKTLARTFSDCAQIIGGVMLILGMALALTNFMIDAGIPDQAVEWVQTVIPNRYVFLIVLCIFLFFAAALMEIYAALVVLVPLLLPLAVAYGIDPVHFGIIFLAAMEVGFLCPPAGMNIYFASAMFKKSIATVARSVLPAMGAIFAGTLLIALVPPLATGLPNLFR